MMRYLMGLLIVENGKNTPATNPIEYVIALSNNGLKNHKVHSPSLATESCAINKFGNVHTKIAISLAVQYLTKYQPVKYPKTIPIAKQQLIQQEPLCESIRYPTFIAKPNAHAANKSVAHGYITNDANKLNIEINCIFFFISFIRVDYVRVRQIGRVHAGVGDRKRLKTIMFMPIRRRFVQVFYSIFLYGFWWVIVGLFLLQGYSIKIVANLLITHNHKQSPKFIAILIHSFQNLTKSQQKNHNNYKKMQVQYRNCNYIGEFNYQSYQRHGYGLLIFDNSQIIMAKWKSNIINGPFVIITDRMRVLGTMINNKLQGYNVISFQESLISNKKQKERTLYGMFRENRLYGQALIIDGEEFIIAHYTDGKLREISERKVVKDRAIFDNLQACFPNQTYNIADWLKQIFAKSVHENSNDGSFKYEPIYEKLEQDTHFYGYKQIFSKNKKVGFLMHQGQVISIGDHENDYLQGLGRLYHSDGTVQDGVFKQGQLCGIGISYSKKNHKYILGQHNMDNQSFEKGFGFPQKEISQIRREFHLRSIYFYNDIVLFSFSTLFEAISANCLNHHLEDQSPRFSSLNNNLAGNQRFHGLPQKSPLRAKIAQYQQQSQRIDDPSPIKNKPINQYERADYRRSKYFDDEEQVPTPPPPAKSGSRKKLQNRSRQDDSRSKQNSRKIKDTKQFVKQLDQKQRKTRGYLDQIYKQAKIYSRKN